ncbi:HAMP domain-containing histidine kinase [Salinimonas marina]|uniref:HAMP domain-containing histidine kinase n=1 Tax=Salinimonas marina TaxID=2785918 RepID=A0A7S9DUU4_9ALTE|nr:HAMP domain-containing sensor histidine kinase [Salinimonas marina]QPG04290.1 HAMP domain-containing histidine kinase [Salinimonas marina]
MPETPEHPTHHIDFSSVLAAAVHDMKNSLSLLIQSIEQLSEVIDAADNQANAQVASVHYEATRLNTSLVQLLSLYRTQLDTLPVTVEQCFIADLLEDVMGAVRLYKQHKNVSVSVQCDDDLSWYLDSELVYMLINDAIINALRYGKQHIQVSAFVEHDELVIKVEDDGEGYPLHMLKQSQTRMAEFTLSQGRTGLGIFFARLIASAHTRGQKKGRIILSNGGLYSGSVFEVKIP